MKIRLVSLTILSILIMGVFHSVNASQLSILESQSEERVNNPKSSKTLDDPSFEVEIESQPLESLSKFDEALPRQISPLVVNNVSTNQKIVQSEQDDLVVNIDLEKNTIPSGMPLYFSIQATRGLLPVEGTEVRLEIVEGEYWGYYYWWAEEYYNYQARIVKTQQITIGPDGEYQGTFQPPKDGVFTLVVRDLSSNVLQSRAFTVADIGIFWRVPWEYIIGEEHYSVAYVLNTTDFSPVTNVAVELSTITYEYLPGDVDYEVNTDLVFTGVTDESGVVEISFVPLSDFSSGYLLANLSATYNGRSVYVSRELRQGDNRWWWGIDQGYNPYEFVITTDKPIYTPGESIQARILVWKNDYYKVTKEPVRETFTLRLLSPSQHILVQRELATDTFGVATYSFPLDTDIELGKYTLEAKKGEIQSFQEIRVDRYEKPAFRVDLLLDRDYVPPGELITGTLSAEYYFGKPVVNGEIALAIDAITTLTGVTDSEGVWKFEYPLPSASYLEGRESIKLNATVIDTVGREVKTSTEVQVSEYIYAWAYVNPWFPKANENITVYYGAFQQSEDYRFGWWRYVPLPDATVRLKLYSLSGFGTSYYFSTLQGETDDNGQGSVTFQISPSILRYYSNFRVTVEVDPGDGRKVATDTYFSVNRNYLDITLSSDTVNQGGDVEFLAEIINGITQKRIGGTIQIRIFDPDYDLIGSLTAELASGARELQFSLSMNAPRGKYYIHTYLETRIRDNWWNWIYYSYQGTFEFSVGSIAQSVSLVTERTEYSLKDQIKITGSVQGITNTPVMVQLVKRGIVLTEFIPKDSVTSFTLDLNDVSALAPRFWAFAFVILSDGTILETYLEIKIDTSLKVMFQSDKDIYKPKDIVKLDIDVFDAHDNPISTLAALSFVDSSVFGVEPDPETERNFFQDSQYWPSVYTVASWKNRQHFWWFWWYEGDVFFGGGVLRGEEPTAFGDAGGPELSSQSNTESKITNLPSNSFDVRDYLPENAYWNPKAILDGGKLTFQLILPDTIGEWTVRAVVTTQTGQGILAKTTLKTFIPFFVDLDKPPQVLQDDMFVLKGVVYNYLDETVTIQVKIETAKGLLLLGNADQQLRLPAGFIGAISWTTLALETGNQNVTFYASTRLINQSLFTDAIRKPVFVSPNGITEEVQESGFISNGVIINYTRYAESVKTSEFLELSLGLGSVALTSWERLIGYPYGCTEQTISRLIPDALIYQYLDSTGELQDETKAMLRDMITSGLSRLYSQRHPDGGWGWWSSDTSRVYMTAIVLNGLIEVNRTGIYTDSNIIKDALAFIVKQQNQDGSWNQDSWGHIDKNAFTGFVLRAAFAWKNLLKDDTPIKKAVTYIETSWSNPTNQSPYLAGLYLDSISGSGYETPGISASLITYLYQEAILTSTGYYWKYSSDDNSIWRALGGDTEITALALKGLVLHDATVSMPVVRGALHWLLERQSWYGWGNTADTAAAISSIIAISESPISSDADTVASLIINGVPIRNFSLSINNHSSFYIDIEPYLINGVNTLQLAKIAGSGNISFYFQANQILRALPIIDIPPEIISGIGAMAAITIDLAPSSSYVLATQVEISPLPGSMIPITPTVQNIDLLAGSAQVVFTFQSPSEIGEYEIPGFEITYQLTNPIQTVLSPGIISRYYGPILISVNENSEFFIPLDFSPPPPVHRSTGFNSKIQEATASDLRLTRMYSTTGKTRLGDLVTVTLTISNTKGPENFLMLQDFLPVGFSIDESTIQHPQVAYTRTKSGITFFFSALEMGDTIVKYGLVADNPRQSLAPPAELASMYDDWIVKSSSAVLGASRVRIDPVTNSVLRDLQKPVLEDLSIVEVLHEFSPAVAISVKATDNWGISSVRVYAGNSNVGKWIVLDCEEQPDSWSILASNLEEGQTQFYVEIMDEAGNVLVTDSMSYYVEFRDLVIPFLPIIGLVVLAFLTGLGASVFVRRKSTWN
ncbi:MAG: MG2 domain-containing protein [Candidatus Heimdallarchaeota archaeon]